MGEFISKDLNILLNCRRNLSHEFVKKVYQDEEIYVKNEIKDLKFKLPPEYKKHSVNNNDLEDLCWFILFDFMLRFYVKNANAVLEKVRPILERNKKSPLIYNQISINFLNNAAHLFYNLRIIFLKKIANIGE
jgi:hypothetical protein